MLNIYFESCFLFLAVINSWFVSSFIEIKQKGNNWSFRMVAQQFSWIKISHVYIFKDLFNTHNMKILRLYTSSVSRPQFRSSYGRYVKIIKLTTLWGGLMLTWLEINKFLTVIATCFKILLHLWCNFRMSKWNNDSWFVIMLAITAGIITLTRFYENVRSA